MEISQNRDKTLAECDSKDSSNAGFLAVLRNIFCFPVAMAALLIVFCVITVGGRFDDPDLWWHLKLGQIMWTTHTIPFTDLFSYTTNHQSTIPQEWLSQVSIYAAYKWGGLSGLMLWLCILSSLQVIAGYGLCSLYSGNAKVAIMGAIAIGLFGTVGFAIRPHMLANVLLIAELLLIHLGRTRNPRWFYWLPVLFVVWINCHGSFILGFIVASVYISSSMFRFRFGSLVSHRWERRRRNMFLRAIIISLAGLLLNPAGIRQIFYPFDTMFKMSVVTGQVAEWAALTVSDMRGAGLFVDLILGLLFLSFLLVATHRSELFWDEFLLLLLGAWLAFSHVRMLPVFGILVAPVLSRQLANSFDGYDARKDRIWPNAVLIGMSLVAAWIAFPDRQALEKQVEEQSPVKAVQFIKASHLSGPMLNDYALGGYLIWAAPEYPVMIDGRTDVYEWSGFINEFGAWATSQSDANILLQKYKVNFCLLDRNSPMAHVLPLMREWKLIYSDDNSVIFSRTPTENKMNGE